MPPPAAPEQTESAAAVPEADAPKRLFSPLGYAVTGVVMLLTAVIVYWATAQFSQPAALAPLTPAEYEEVELGQFSRELPPSEASLLRDLFSVKVVLQLNPRHRRLPEVKALVERRRNQLRDIVWTEIVYAKSDAELRKPDILKTLREEIKQKLNSRLEKSKEGQDVIEEVLFPEPKLPLPAHR